MTVDITIPVLNEEKTLEKNVLILKEFLTKSLSEKIKATIVIADNGSTDTTGEIATRLESHYPDFIRYIRTPKGVGRALKTSWQSSSADIVSYMDLDLATDIKHIPEAVEKLLRDEADLVYGTRLHPKSKVIGRSLKREISSRAFNLILKIYLRTKFSDGMCGFKFLKRSHLERILSNGASSDGWFFCTEILAVAEWLKLRTFELPVTWVDDNESKVKIIKLSLEYLRAMKDLKMRRSVQ